MSIEALKELAQEARQRSPIACIAMDADTILKLVTVVEKAQTLVRWMDAPMKVPTAHDPLTRVKQSVHSDEKKAAWAALRSSLAALDDRETA